MLPIQTTAVYFIPYADVSAADAVVLKRLEKILAERSDKKEWFAGFEQQCPASNSPVWQRLQQKVAPNSKQYNELSFALAYYGKDYDVNLKRLTRPYRIWRNNITAPHNKSVNQETISPKERSADWDNEWLGWGRTWYSLNLLYLKRHDLTSLGLWLDQGLDGGPAEQSDDELGKLWNRHKKDILRAASRSSQRINHLAETFLFDYSDSKSMSQLLLQELHDLSLSDESAVAAAARQVSDQLRSRLKEVDASDKNTKKHIKETERKAD